MPGWPPQYFPPQLVRAINSLLQDKVPFGTDCPLLTQERWLRDFSQLGIKPAAEPEALRENAVRLLGLGSYSGWAADRRIPRSVLRSAAEAASVKISICCGSGDRTGGHAARTAGYAMEFVSVDNGEITNPFTVRVSRDGNSAWLAIAGELDFDGVQCLGEKMAELAAIRPVPAMIRVDLTGLTFVDAAGARALVAGCQRLHQQCRWFEAWGVHPRVERVLGLIGIPLPGRRASCPPAGRIGLPLRPLTWPASGKSR